MNRVANVRISTLSKTVADASNISITSVYFSNGSIIVEDGAGNVYDLRQEGCSCKTTQASIIATLLRGVDGITPDMSDYYDKNVVEEKLSLKQDEISDLGAIRSNASKGATAVQPSELASVAKSGEYGDLKNRPYIPSEVTERTVSNWGFTKNSGNYNKPSSGIPITDLESKAQTALSKTDALDGMRVAIYNLLISKQDTIDDLDAIREGAGKGATAVQRVKVNGKEVAPSNGVVNLGTVDYPTKKEVDSAIALAITTTLNTPV